VCVCVSCLGVVHVPVQFMCCTFPCSHVHQSSQQPPIFFFISDAGGHIALAMWQPYDTGQMMSDDNDKWLHNNNNCCCHHHSESLHPTSSLPHPANIPPPPDKGQWLWVVANGDGDDDVMVAMRRWWWGGGGGWASSMVVVVVVVEEEGIDGLTMPKLRVGKCWCFIWASLILFLSFRGHSFHVIPGTIPAECEFRSTFRWNSFINLAGNCAKIDSYGILGIDRIPPDSSRNQWRTVKTSIWWTLIGKTICTLFFFTFQSYQLRFPFWTICRGPWYGPWMQCLMVYKY